MHNVSKIDIYVAIAFILSVLLLLPACSSSSGNPNVTVSASGVVQYGSSNPSTPINKAIYVYGAGPLTSSQISSLAAHFTLLDVSFSISLASLQAIKTQNPNMKIIGYEDLIAATPGGANWTQINSNEDWFVHDDKGNRIMNTAWGWMLMNISSLGWKQFYVSYANSQINNTVYDGVFADDCWDTVSSPQPLNGTIPASLVSEWHQDMLSYLQYIKANLLPGKIVVINDALDTDFLNAVDGEMYEGFAHASFQDLNTYGSSILGALSGLPQDEATGKIVWCASGAEIPSNPNSTMLGQLAETVKYCYSAFLLTLNGSQAYFSFDVNNDDGANGYYSIMDANIGQPTGAYYSSQNVYMRDFTGGKVLLNPSGSSYNINLGSNYELLNGTTVSSVALAPWTGEILLPPM